MAASRHEILRGAPALAEADRTELIAALASSLDSESELGVENAWRREIERRAAELESGGVRSIPWDVVRGRLRRATGG
jgi:putative addiction module component (TIGR02574 family)